jgi:hypothetical protein
MSPITSNISPVSESLRWRRQGFGRQPRLSVDPSQAIGSQHLGKKVDEFTSSLLIREFTRLFDLNNRVLKSPRGCIGGRQGSCIDGIVSGEFYSTFGYYNGALSATGR